jgi:hypothetical protein
MANNLRFCEHLIGARDITQHWLKQCETTTPDTRPITTLADEADINLFFQCDQAPLRAELNLPATTSNLAVFEHIRTARNHW